MPKTRIDVSPPWEDTWIVSFDHTPAEIQTRPSIHAIHVYKDDFFPWPERIWEMWFPTEAQAAGFATLLSTSPQFSADVCYFCNPCYALNRMIRKFNISLTQLKHSTAKN